MTSPTAVELIEPNNEDLLRSFSWICGITYAILFGGSLMLQAIINYCNQSTKGFSTDYALTGFVGFFFLLLNQTIGRIDPSTDAGRVHMMDLIFAQSAFVSGSISYTQTFIYPSHKSLRSTRIVVAVILTVFFAAATLETQFEVQLKSYAAISLIDLAAYIKAGSSLVKYLFQIRENFINKSTEGVSKAAFWTDFLGGFFCFMQLQIDSRIAGYTTFLADPQLNLAKTLIAFFGLCNTSIILIQIHCIYSGQPRLKMVHPDSTFGSSDDEQYAGEGVEFEAWNGYFDKDNKNADRKPQLKQPMLTGGSKESTSSTERASAYYSP